MKEIESIINQLGLNPHPEGGFYKETYRSSGNIKNESLAAEYNGHRSYCTAIYFLLTSDNFSAFHKIKQDEMWHFYDGSAIRLHMITPEGEYSNVLIGKNYANGEHPQYVVPGGVWFASEVSVQKSYALAGCTVSPGFDFQDFDLAARDMLTKMFPQHGDVIARLTKQ